MDGIRTLSVERVMRPIFIIAFFMGCGIYRLSNGYPRFWLSSFYIISVWSVYAWSVYNLLTIFTPASPKSFVPFLNLFIYGINLFLWVVSVFITFYKYEENWMCIKQLNLVDDTLKELGISKEFSRIQKEIKWSLILWIMLICTLSTFDTLASIQQNLLTQNSVILAIISPWIIMYCLHINTLLDLMIVFILRYIGTRLDTINDCIIQLSEIEDCELRCKETKSLIVSRHYIRSIEYCKHVLWTTMHLHFKLCRVARNINSLYGIQMTVQMSTYFAVCTVAVYVAYHVSLCLSSIQNNEFTKWFYRISLMLWTTFFLSKLLTVNHICESVSAKAEKTKIVIHKLTNLIRFTDMHNEIYQFGLQISLHPLKFNGMGLFYFGYKFVRSFTVWVFTITLLLVQVDTIFLLRISSNSNVTACF